MMLCYFLYIRMMIKCKYREMCACVGCANRKERLLLKVMYDL